MITSLHSFLRSLCCQLCHRILICEAWLLQWSTDDDAEGDGGVSGGSPAKAPLRLSSPAAGSSFKPKERLGGGGSGTNTSHAKKYDDSSVSLKRRWSDEEVENLKKGVDR